MSLAPGTRLGPYEILRAIGAGGMGEVYQATDPRMGRDVAIKISAERFNDRFSREVHAVAALNHPNICTLYDVGPNYLVMELIDGPTLSDRIKQGAIPPEEALAIAVKIAGALDAAHEKGIVHRDLKPGNIKIKPDGTVKVLDFGLAKTVDQPVAASPEVSPTLSMAATQAGVILGTAAYMSPEQARGKAVDKRADIWAFGVVLYEMLTGKRLFQGEDLTEIVASVVKDQPDLSAIPEPAKRLLERCLEKDPKKRLRDIGDMGLLLEPAPQSALPRSRAGILAWSIAGALAVALAVFAFVYFRQKPASMAPVRFQIQAPAAGTGFPFLSPDGRKLAILVGGRLWVHSFESGESHDLTAADGTPFWSADSHFLGFAIDSKIKKIEATGGPLQTVADYSGDWGGGAWNRDDLIVFGTTAGGLFRVSASGGVPVQITAFDSARQENAHYWPSFLPDGRHFTYSRSSNNWEKGAIYLGSVDAKPEQQSLKPLLVSNWSALYAPSADPDSGYLLFMREGTLMQQPFDNRRLEVQGTPSPIADQVAALSNVGGFGAFSTSNNNALVFRQNVTSERQLTWYDRQGKVLSTVGDPADYQAVALSPDGTRVALSKRTLEATNIWLLDTLRDSNTRFTFGSKKDTYPVWSPDGTRIVFSSGDDLYQKPVSGVNEAELLLKSGEDAEARSWSRDGHFLLYDVQHSKTKYDIWVLPLEGDKKPVPFLVTEFVELDAHFSPDGRWVAYASNESGRPEVYVRSFSPNSAGAGGKWLVSNGTGFNPHWRSDGRELYYLTYPEGRMMAVDLSADPVFRAGKPQPLGLAIPLRAAWDSTADGKRFLVAVPKTSTGPESYTVILNWQTGLKK